MNDIFTIEKLEHTTGHITAEISINEHSAILKGHFPGRPVVPGACMMQLLKDVLADALQHFLILKQAGNLKFMRMLTPVNDSQVYLSVTYKITDDAEIPVNAKLTAGDVICFKFNGSFLKTKPVC